MARVAETKARGNGIPLVAFHGPTQGAKRLLWVGHMDTVYPAGTAKCRPFRIAGNRAMGPGVHDLDRGTTVNVGAIQGRERSNVVPDRPAHSHPGRPGPRGGRIHSPDEILEVPSLRERAALLALFIQTWYEEFPPAAAAERRDLA